MMKTRALAREFLHDWEAVWIVVAHPYLPLTNHRIDFDLRNLKGPQAQQAHR